MSDAEESNGTGDGSTMDLIRKHRKGQLAAEAAALDRLHASVMSTHDQASRMNRELKDQDVLISNVERGVGAASQEAQSQTRSVGQMVEQSKNNGFLLTVAALLIVIIVLLWV